MRTALVAASILALSVTTSISFAQSQGAPAGGTNSPAVTADPGNTSVDPNKPPIVDTGKTGSTTMTPQSPSAADCSAYDKARTAAGHGDEMTDMAKACGNRKE